MNLWRFWFVLCLLALAAIPIFMIWGVAAKQYRQHLQHRHPAFLERVMREAPPPRGAYRSLVYLAKQPAPDMDSEPLRKRARVLRVVANAWLWGFASATFFLAFLLEYLEVRP